MVARIHLIAGARPNFMKIAPLWHAMKNLDDIRVEIVHTGQHNDPDMSDAFFQDLDLPHPHFNLLATGQTHAQQTASVMVAYERLCMDQRPDLTVVVGDVNSSLAAAISAKKLTIPVAHLEAGLRSRDMRMPEEINRLLIDRISDYLWTPSADADENLLREGVEPERIALVGNIMIDSFEFLRHRIEAASPWAKIGLRAGKYGVVTLHRPSNVDDAQTLRRILENLVLLSQRAELPFVFPMHPRTRKRIKEYNLLGILETCRSIIVQKPMGYIEFMGLLKDSCLAMTDSGGIQEETSYLGIPCLTLRDNTERPITISEGTNFLTSIDKISQDFDKVVLDYDRTPRKIKFWDGHTSDRVLREIRKNIYV